MPKSKKGKTKKEVKDVKKACKYALSVQDQKEPLLKENPLRFVLFPIQHDDMWRMYKKHVASFWTAEEIDLTHDYKDWVALSKAVIKQATSPVATGGQCRMRIVEEFSVDKLVERTAHQVEQWT